MLVASELGFEDLWRASADRLLAARDPETGLWEQNLWGRVDRHLGAAHGFAGCVLALGDFEGAAETARRYAVVEDGLANWPPARRRVLVRNGTIRVQWCHGAPGMITSLGRRPRRGPRARRRRADVAGGPARQGRGPLPRHRRQRLRFPHPVRAHGRRALARPGPPVRRPLDRAGRTRTRRPRDGPLQPVDRRPRDRALPRRLHRRSRAAAASLAAARERPEGERGDTGDHLPAEQHPADVDRGLPTDLAVLDHVGADRPRAQPEAAAAVVLAVAASSTAACRPTPPESRRRRPARSGRRTPAAR